MKINSLALCFCLVPLLAGMAQVPTYDPHRDGASAELDILVVDDMGIPVPEVDMCVSFATGPVDGIDRAGRTDKTAASQRVAELPAQSGFWPKRKATIKLATMWMRNKYRMTRRYKHQVVRCVRGDADCFEENSQSGETHGAWRQSSGNGLARDEYVAWFRFGTFRLVSALWGRPTRRFAAGI